MLAQSACANLFLLMCDVLFLANSASVGMKKSLWSVFLLVVRYIFFYARLASGGSHCILGIRVHAAGSRECVTKRNNDRAPWILGLR